MSIDLVAGKSVRERMMLESLLRKRVTVEDASCSALLLSLAYALALSVAFIAGRSLSLFLFSSWASLGDWR